MVRAVSIRQPWAEMIARGIVRALPLLPARPGSLAPGPLVVCAARRPDETALRPDLATSRQQGRTPGREGCRGLAVLEPAVLQELRGAAYALGVAVCVVEVVAVRGRHPRDEWLVCAREFPAVAPWREIADLGAVARIAPVPVSGARGFFPFPHDLATLDARAVTPVLWRP